MQARPSSHDTHDTHDTDDTIASTGLARVELVVTDLARSRRFYTEAVGLEPLADAPDGACVLAVPGTADRVVLRPGPRAGCSLAAWRVAAADDLDRLAHRLAGAGIDCVREGRTAVRFIEPASGAALAFEHRPADGAGAPAAATHTRIERLGHVVFATPQADAAVARARDWLDFRVSDWIEGRTTFLRPARSPFHHGLGIARAAGHGLHHLNFMVAEIDDIGRAQHRLARLGAPVVFGPGRHPVSGSAFLYFLDPDGLTLEYSFGMETFPPTGARAPRPWPAVPESVDLWGAPRHPDLGRHGALLAPEAALSRG